MQLVQIVTRRAVLPWERQHSAHQPIPIGQLFRSERHDEMEQGSLVDFRQLSFAFPFPERHSDHQNLQGLSEGVGNGGEVVSGSSDVIGRQQRILESQVAGLSPLVTVSSAGGGFRNVAGLSRRDAYLLEVELLRVYLEESEEQVAEVDVPVEDGPMAHVDCVELEEVDEQKNESIRGETACERLVEVAVVEELFEQQDERLDERKFLLDLQRKGFVKYRF